MKVASVPSSSRSGFARRVGATRSVVDKTTWLCGMAEGRDVLDLGCADHDGNIDSHGDRTWLHEELSRKASKLVGVDHLESQTASLRKRGYDVVTADVENFDLGHRFDLVVAGDIIEHLTAPGAMLRSAARHLRPDGRIAVTTPNPFALSNAVRVGMRNGILVNVDHTCWFSPTTMHTLADKVGLDIVDFTWLADEGTSRLRRRTEPRRGDRSAEALVRTLVRLRPYWNEGFGVVISVP